MPIRTSVMQNPTPPTPAPRELPQTPGTPVAVAQIPVEMLQIQAAALVRQLAGLEVQSQYLDHQSEADGISQAAKAQIDANHANVDVQIAQARADLENVRGQIAARAHVPMSRISENGQIQMQQPPRPHSQPDPDMVVGLSFALLIAIGIPISIAYARRIWRGKPQLSMSKADEIAPRLDRIEQAMDAIAIEVERVSEGQRFVTKILAERPQAMAPAAVKAAVDDAIPAASPILALGAGPIEPIRKAERQAVRQSMHTPH